VAEITAMKKMHQTTVRFGTDLWSMLEAEAAATGVSAAQYVRDATLARLAYTFGRRGGSLSGETAVANAMALEQARSGIESSAALWAQGHLARERARKLRDDARKARIDVQSKRVPRGANRAPQEP